MENINVTVFACHNDGEINLPLETEIHGLYKGNKFRISKHSLTIFCSKNKKEILFEQNFSEDFSNFISQLVNKRISVNIKISYFHIAKTLYFPHSENYKLALIDFVKKLSYIGGGIGRIELTIPGEHGHLITKSSFLADPMQIVSCCVCAISFPLDERTFHAKIQYGRYRHKFSFTAIVTKFDATTAEMCDFIKKTE